MQQFCAELPFEETPDQQNAIAAVIADMQAAKPMDRPCAEMWALAKPKLLCALRFLPR
ncbi:MAG: hypothetical protein R3E67_02765 [Pseudomonadales bacterium]